VRAGRNSEDEQQYGRRSNDESQFRISC